jgi:hypothetical protein
MDATNFTPPVALPSQHDDPRPLRKNPEDTKYQAGITPEIYVVKNGCVVTSESRCRHQVRASNVDAPPSQWRRRILLMPSLIGVRPWGVRSVTLLP